MEDWKNLEIGNIPSDFFVNERYEFQSWNNATPNHKETGWSTDEMKERTSMIDCLLRGQISYRYKLKPLKSIRVTKEVFDCLVGTFGRDMKIADYFGRKVEIIGDDE